MEASALHAPPGVSRIRGTAGTPFLRLRSDEQLVELFRAGHEEAFRVIHDRYRARLFAYMRQMLPGGRQDAEDALQDVFIRAYAGLRANDRHVALRAWLYRVAHNRCVDQLRKNMPLLSDEIEVTSRDVSTDPSAAVEQRESLRKLVADVQRLPDQQRSALLMREMSGMSYQELADSMDLSVPAIKSLLVRARGGLAAAAEARNTSCTAIHAEILASHERGARPNALTRRHLSECAGCREYREQVRGVSARLNALVPAGPMLLALKLLGIGSVYSAATYSGGAAAAGSGALAAGAGAGSAAAAAGAGSATASSLAGGVAAGGAAASAGSAAAGGALIAGGVSAGHVAAIIAAAAAAGGAVAVTQQATPHRHHAVAAHPAASLVSTAASQAINQGYSPAAAVAPIPTPRTAAPTAPAAPPHPRTTPRATTTSPAGAARTATTASTASTTASTASTSATTGTSTAATTATTASAGTGTGFTTTPAATNTGAAGASTPTAASTGTAPAGTPARTDSTSASGAQTSGAGTGSATTPASSGTTNGSTGTGSAGGTATTPSNG